MAFKVEQPQLRIFRYYQCKSERQAAYDGRLQHVQGIDSTPFMRGYEPPAPQSAAHGGF